MNNVLSMIWRCSQVGYCNGVENYARHLAGREEGTPPECLIDYFPDDWLLIVDESRTYSQLQAMYNGDQARKKVLIEHGFRCLVQRITVR